jgi:ABC-type bacteriocin/lantibiotic exporter with double-glycine peptidase domain
VKETSRLAVASNSPVLSFFNEATSGASTIRAFDQQERFIKQFQELLNASLWAKTCKEAINNWF